MTTGVRRSLIGCLTTLTAHRMDFAPIRTLKTIQCYSSERKTCHASDDPTIPCGHMYRACPNLYYRMASNEVAFPHGPRFT